MKIIENTYSRKASITKDQNKDKRHLLKLASIVASVRNTLITRKARRIFANFKRRMTRMNTMFPSPEDAATTCSTKSMEETNTSTKSNRFHLISLLTKKKARCTAMRTSSSTRKNVRNDRSIHAKAAGGSTSPKCCISQSAAMATNTELSRMTKELRVPKHPEDTTTARQPPRGGSCNCSDHSAHAAAFCNILAQAVCLPWGVKPTLVTSRSRIAPM
mmetsp:Transcript_119885/g.334468  ORF Transcript_119885/g.334468 Transcript_119885/m.334468 type:complete len:217 (+) Transcript_119885:825-1475(+)